MNAPVSLIIPGVRAPDFDPVAEVHGRLAAARIDLDGITLLTNQILVAPHALPEKIGSIIRADQTKAEDRWQGKVGLVLKVGPMAFQDDAVNKFSGLTVKPGDWVVTHPTAGMEVGLGHPHKWRDQHQQRVICKVVQDVHIQMVVTDPDGVY